MGFIVGEKVKLRKGAPLYKSSTSLIASSTVKEEKITNITRVAAGTKHPYNTTGDLGWMNASDITKYEEKDKYEVEIEVIDKDDLLAYLEKHTDKIVMIDSKELYDVIRKQL